MTKNQLLALKPGDKVRVCAPHLHTHRMVRTVRRRCYGAIQVEEGDGYLYMSDEIEHYRKDNEQV